MGHRLGLGIIGMGLESAGIRILPDAEPDPVPHNKWDKPLEE
jgi:hypothetical protein